MNFVKQDFPLFDNSTLETTYVTIILGVFLISQFLFFINIILSTFNEQLASRIREQLRFFPDDFTEKKDVWWYLLFA
ncbi:hypothetical protein [Psychroserpens damuponensis]|uniref:hypothetical protein n=1 Tax=Psychroserpens damuponensis TaxID=943936 RepID=UPI001269E7A7|nr:hypothetical protein [Psychroserpens damuponensis]